MSEFKPATRQELTVEYSIRNCYDNDEDRVKVSIDIRDTFKIPVSVDLMDKEVVDEYWVKWRELHIRFKDGKELVVKEKVTSISIDGDDVDNINEDDIVTTDNDRYATKRPIDGIPYHFDIYCATCDEHLLSYNDGDEQVTFDGACPKCASNPDNITVEDAGGELTNDICEACGAERRVNYDWAFRDDGKKSFCRPCGKKYDNGELDK